MTMKKLLLTTMCMLGLAACANGSNKENNTKKENTMKTIALTKADSNRSGTKGSIVFGGCHNSI